MKKIAVAGIIAAAAVAAAVGGGAAFHANYAILGKNLIAEDGNTEHDDVYRLDAKELWLSHRLNSFTASELNRCTAVESLMLHCPDNATLAKLGSFEHLDALTFFHDDETLTADGMAFISRQPALDTVWFFGTNADLTGIRSDSVRKVILYGCEISNLSELANCPAMEELSCTNLLLGDHLWSQDETDPEVNQYFTDTDGEEFVIRPMEDVVINYYMDDSSDFAPLDQVKKLSFSDVIFHDISGLLDMDSLETLELGNCEMSDADRKALTDKGIAVTDAVHEETDEKTEYELAP